MWMPSSQVWVSPLAERTSSAPTIARMEATAGQKRCRMFIPDPQDSNRRRPHQDVRSRKWPGRKEEKKHAATNGGMAGWKGCLSQQSSNVLFGQSRNVLLTGSSLEGGRRTTTDDPGRARPAGGLEEGQEETDHAEAGCRGDRHHRAAGAATPAEAAAERRPGGNP